MSQIRKEKWLDLISSSLKDVARTWYHTFRTQHGTHMSWPLFMVSFLRQYRGGRPGFSSTSGGSSYSFQINNVRRGLKKNPSQGTDDGAHTIGASRPLL